MPSPLAVVPGSHAIVLLIEWEIFKTCAYHDFFNAMEKPAFVFDGRYILDHDELAFLGFTVKAIGKSM